MQKSESGDGMMAEPPDVSIGLPSQISGSLSPDYCLLDSGSFPIHFSVTVITRSSSSMVVWPAFTFSQPECWRVSMP
jgi:hypothetical protein